jgi:L-threonylcarbamoyladenylate synthase
LRNARLAGLGRHGGGEAGLKARVLSAESPAAVGEAAAALRAGGLVAFPTETVYGLGADAGNATAVARVFAAKARPAFDPLIVHVAEASNAARVAVTDDERVAALAARFWPGPLTLVLPKRPGLPDLVTAGLQSVGVRVPDHQVARDLITRAGTPLAAPSANPFGSVSPTTAAHVAETLGDVVDVILDGGPCRVGLESTVLSLLADPAVILRPGGVSSEDLEAVLGRRLEVRPSSSRPESPGQLLRHYATQTPLSLLAGAAPAEPPGRGRIGLLALRRAPEAHGYAAVEVLAPDGSLTTAATGLFAALRRLDSLGLQRIVAEPCADEGLGRAILDRLRRAAEQG